MTDGCCFFFFQAEDGIRDLTVTGVQTCALPISFVDGLRDTAAQAAEAGTPVRPLDQLKAVTCWAMQTQLEGEMPSLPAQNSNLSASLQSNDAYMDRLIEIGRASCRERV